MNKKLKRFCKPDEGMATLSFNRGTGNEFPPFNWF